METIQTNRSEGNRIFTTDFGDILQRRKKELSEFLSRQIPPSLSDIEPGDHITFQQPIKANCDRVKREIEEIDEAIKRWQQGTFGICLDCGKSIPEERLILIPHAKRCRECQSLVFSCRGKY